MEVISHILKSFLRCEKRMSVRRKTTTSLNSYQGQCQMGSLTGAVHLSNDNAGVPRSAQSVQKTLVEYNDKCWLDPDFQYE